MKGYRFKEWFSVLSQIAIVDKEGTCDNYRIVSCIAKRAIGDNFLIYGGRTVCVAAHLTMRDHVTTTEVAVVWPVSDRV